MPPAGGRNRDLLTRRAGSVPGADLSVWSSSTAKRVFDCACVVAALPMLIPTLLLVALAVWTTSRGPVLFRQKRVGRGGRPFTIVKFRTLRGNRDDGSAGQRFTAIGRGLRRLKLDELPQLLNVLVGDMSLVGPRPKMREYQLRTPTCRPGITGAATIVFAREEELLERVLRLRSAETYRTVVMTAKHCLDTDYMARATFLSDLNLLVRTLLRRWDTRTLQAVIGIADSPCRDEYRFAEFSNRRKSAPLQGPALPRMAQVSTVETAIDI